MGAMGKIALTHLALHVRNIAESVTFYERFCGMRVIHRRTDQNGRESVVWLSEPGRERELIFVLISGGPARSAKGADYSHLGFALESRDAVDEIAARGEHAGCLVWPAREEPYPVGYYCGLRDPDGNFVEFSFGQPLGTGAEELDDARAQGGQGYEREPS